MNLRKILWAIISLFFGSQSLLAQDHPYIFGAIGDSISSGFNAYKLGDNRDLSWSTGNDLKNQVLSHAKRIQNQLGHGRQVQIHNESFVGADSTHLQRQVRRLLRVKPDYVTLAIGANDVCTWFDDYEQKLARYKSEMRSAISSLIAANSAVKIVLVPVPSLRMMYESGARQLSCRAKWNIIRICKPLLAEERTSEERERVYERQTELNQALEVIADEFSQNVRFAKAIADASIDSSMISSLDCFHPNILGQNKFSELTFDPNWY